MKKFYLLLGIAVSLISIWHVFIASQKNNLYSKEALANIQALAIWEELTWENILNPPVTPKIKRTERCAYYDGRGYTSSVKRECYDIIICTDCRCTPVPCGEAFYD